MIESFLVAALALQMAGCDLSRSHLDTWLSDADVVGDWVLSPRSLGVFMQHKFRPGKSHRNTLFVRKDRSCTFASVDANDVSATYVVLEGTWRLDHATRTTAERAAQSNVLRLALRSQCAQFPEYREFSLARDLGSELYLSHRYPEVDATARIEYHRLA